ncbi:MAG: hypothetical protein IKI75_05620 [Lachnospiraceae bacterium]|nr:hypothetical protein [Lachnospiraceae bacterium]
MVLFYAALHDRGPGEKNQDSMALHRMETRAGEVTMAAVCDGLGGEQCGELASGYLVERLSIWFYDELPESLKGGFSKSRIRRSLQRELFRTHGQLREYGLDRMLRCGTTMTLFLSVGNRYLLFSCGDSTVFSLRRGIKELILRDGDERGVKRCIGIGSFFPPHMSSGRIHGDSAFLLSSDGLLKKLKEGDIQRAMSPGLIKRREEAQRALSGLARAARSRGEKDDISALYLKCC